MIGYRIKLLFLKLVYIFCFGVSKQKINVKIKKCKQKLVIKNTKNRIANLENKIAELEQRIINQKYEYYDEFKFAMSICNGGGGNSFIYTQS